MSEPQPDLALLRPRQDYYAARHPGPADVLLLVEVADTTLASDRGTELSLCLKAGIPEVWVVDPNAEVVHVATAAGGRAVARGESLALQAFPGLSLGMGEMVG